MEIINQRWEWLHKPVDPLKTIEVAGRTCYRSGDRITKDSSTKFAKMIMKRGHESVIEHASASIRFITNRGVTHELVRHRLCSFSQESTRYVNYKGGMQFIRPVWFKNKKQEIDGGAEKTWVTAMEKAEEFYNVLLSHGWRPEQAREVLPNSLKTEIIVTANLREWAHIFKLRTSKAAHPQIMELLRSCLNGFKKEIPVLFENIVL
jgi:thymidylate synthase (FAD)